MRGLIQLNDGSRFAVDVIDLYSNEPGYLDLKCHVIPGVFDRSNRFAHFLTGEFPSDKRNVSQPEIKEVIFNDPATIVIWSDGSKTVVKCQSGDTYSKETGLALCIAKKYLGNKGNFNEVFKKYIEEA